MRTRHSSRVAYKVFPVTASTACKLGIPRFCPKSGMV